MSSGSYVCFMRLVAYFLLSSIIFQQPRSEYHNVHQECQERPFSKSMVQVAMDLSLIDRQSGKMRKMIAEDMEDIL